MRDPRACQHMHRIFDGWAGDVQRGMKADGNEGYDHRPAIYRCEDCGKAFTEWVRV